MNVSAFQATLATASETIGRFQLELQAPAMKALKDAITDIVIKFSLSGVRKK
ncbi:MAG: hypothetical protein ABIU09_10880 [Pyrinomonadaceae bacterium]